MSQPTSAAVPVSGKRIIGYFIQWGIYRRNFMVKNLRTSGAAERMTHINYAFGDVNTSLRCASADEFADYNKMFDAAESVDGVGDTSTTPLRGNFNQLRKLKQLYPHIKVLISLGGWTLSSNFSAAARPENRAAFVASCVDMYLRGNFAAGKVGPGIFDGIDLDWEYPVACGLTCGVPEDAANFTALLQEFRSQMNALSAQTGQQYLLTAALPAGGDKYSLLQLAQDGAIMDFINVMTYDYFGAWDMTTNFNAPLGGDPANPYYSKNYWIQHTIDGYIAAGVPASKLNLGLPFYGRGWTGVAAGPNGDGLYQLGTRAARGKWENGINDYKDIVPLESSYTKRRHPISKEVYIYNGNNWWNYDDPQSMLDKTAYINARGLGGAMFWELSGDTSNISLLSAVYNGLNGGAPPATSTTGPATSTRTATRTATGVLPTATRTATGVLPTATRTSTSALPTATRTSTSVTPPTATSVTPPTATSVPPSATPGGGGDTGYRSPASNSAGPGGDGNGFEVSPANAQADDGQFATDIDSGVSGTQVCGDPVRDSHDFYNYGFALPSGSTIKGIEVRLDGKIDYVRGDAAVCVQISSDGGATWTAAKKTPLWTTAEASYSLGGATDTWGRSWSSTDLANGNLRVRVSTVVFNNVRDFSLDWIAVKVYQ